MKKIVWTEYLKYRAKLRRYHLQKLEGIIRFSNERYLDIATQRLIVIGRYRNILVMIPFEEDVASITPITVHATNRQQINYRIKSGRFINE